jgi:phosphatidylglycerophosphatase C
LHLALFDFDSTITTRDTFADFIRFAAPRSRRWLGMVLLTPLLLVYRAGLVSGHLLRASAVRVGLRGLSLTRAQALGEQFAA